MANPATALIDLSKIVEQFKLPGIDVSTLVEARREDIKVLTHVNKIAFDALLAMTQKQGEILKETMEALQALAQKKTATPMEGAAALGEFGPQALTKAFGYMHELAELTRKFQSEAIDVLNQRAQQNVEELKRLLKPGS